MEEGLETAVDQGARAVPAEQEARAGPAGRTSKAPAKQESRRTARVGPRAWQAARAELKTILADLTRQMTPLAAQAGLQ